jgi:acyl-CoA synthetase (AMP-forming)/AMP-acid ligase II
MPSVDSAAQNLGYWCAAAAARHPDKIAIFDLSRDPPRKATYAELESRLDRVASTLARLGMRPGDRLAMSISNRIEFVETMFGAMRAAVVPVPLNTKLGPDALRYVVEDSGAVGAVVETGANAKVPKIVEDLGLRLSVMLDAEKKGWLDYEGELAASDRAFAPPALPADHMAFLPYTSGSTGKPKGVVLTHAGQHWWLDCLLRYWPMPAESRALVAVPLYHKNAMAGAIKPMLAAGGSVVLLPDFKPGRFLRALSDYHCTHASGVPAVFTLLLQERELIESLDFSSLKGIKIGSAPTPKELLDAVEGAFGVPVSESYGLTEGGPVMIGPPIDGRAVPRGSCGVVWPEGEVKLVTAEGEESPTQGELWVRNPGVTPGYYHLPEINNERLRDGWLKTGDVFERDAAGFFYFRGRTDDMFNSGGENVYPLEVENMLLRHPAVADASVVSAPHAIKGEVPVALVVRAKGHHVSEEELKQFCLANGPAYAHPRRIDFVDELPLNGPGKIDRKVVQRIMRERYGALGH